MANLLEQQLSATMATMPPRSSNARSELSPMMSPTTSSRRRGLPIASSVPASLGNGYKLKRAF
jgi:hypothetical protein